MKPSRSHLARALRLVVSTVLATSAILVPVVTASAADTEAPVLNSVSVSDTAVTPGQQVTFSYAATEGAGSLGLLRLGYQKLNGHSDQLSFDGPLPVAGSVTFTVPDTWWNGLNYVSWVELTDPSGNMVRYSRDGTTRFWPGGVAGPAHAAPFAPGDLTVSASTADTAVPLLTSVAVSGAPSGPGEGIGVHYVATDDAGSLKKVVLSFHDVYGTQRTITDPASGPLPLSGDFDQVIPPTWPNGPYSLVRVSLTDPQDNSSTYSVSGSVSRTPPAATGPSSHTVDFGPAAFAVSGSVADVTPPALTSITRTGSPMDIRGTANLSYASESQDALTYVQFRYVAPSGKYVTFTQTTSQVSGTVPATIAEEWPGQYGLGLYTLQEVSLADSAGNSIRYLRSGTTSKAPGSIAGTHTFALSTMDLKVGEKPLAPFVDGVRVASGSAVVFFSPRIEQATPITRYTVTAQPGGRSVTTSGSAARADMTGLTNGTMYRFTVKATNMFGTGPASAPSAAATPMMSTNIVATGDFSGDLRNDLIGVKFTTEPMKTSRPSYLYRGNGSSGFTTTNALNHPFSDQDLIVFSPGDFDGDGKSDVMVVGDQGHLLLQPGNGRGGFMPVPARDIGRGWVGMRNVFGPGDFSGDRKNDVLAVTRTGDLYLFRGNGHGGWASAAQKIGSGWGTFLTVFSHGDFSGDGRSDVMAVSKDGGMYLYRGNGRGGFASAGQRIGNGWGSFLSVFSPGDFSGDNRGDVMAVTAAGDLRLYRGNGRGGWADNGVRIGSNWDSYR